MQNKMPPNGRQKVRRMKSCGFHPENWPAANFHRERKSRPFGRRKERKMEKQLKPLIFQSDFGRADGAVSAMYGVAYSVCSELKISDLTHEIPQYDIWEASYRLIQTVSYWPEGTVFVSVVDPGVGSTRRSIVVQTCGGQYVVTPDNGTLTHVKHLCGIRAARVIDETVNRLPGSGESYTFHGRDIYAYTGARLAAGIIDFEGVGPRSRWTAWWRSPMTGRAGKRGDHRHHRRAGCALRKPVDQYPQRDVLKARHFLRRYGGGHH